MSGLCLYQLEAGSGCWGGSVTDYIRGLLCWVNVEMKPLNIWANKKILQDWKILQRRKFATFWCRPDPDPSLKQNLGVHNRIAAKLFRLSFYNTIFVLLIMIGHLSSINLPKILQMYKRSYSWNWEQLYRSDRISVRIRIYYSRILPWTF